jgi:hypothetical protein
MPTKKTLILPAEREPFEILKNYLLFGFFFAF